MGRYHHNRPDLLTQRETFVYFARAYPSGLIKIGYSNCPNGRAHDLAWELGQGVSLLFTVPGNRVQEKGFHKRFTAYRSHGEWFHEAGDLHQFLREKGYAGTKVIIEKQVVQVPGPTRIVEVLKPQIPAAAAKPQTIGYARVSTEDQDLAMQLTKLREAKCDILFEEKIGATNAKRPQFQLMMKYLEPGDTLVIYSCSRLARDLPTLHAIVKQLEVWGVTLRSITEPHLNTKTATGRLMFNIQGAFDQFERDKIAERTTHGMEELKRRGVRLGRKPIISEADARKMAAERKSGADPKDLAKRYRCKVSTVYARTNKLKKKSC